MSEPSLNAVEELLRENDEYRRLREEHAQHERRLDALHGQPFLSDADQREIAEIKKRKLVLKDRMLQISSALAST